MTMPPKLRKAHQANDEQPSVARQPKVAVMRAYGFPEGLSESEIVARLFALYAKLADAKTKKGQENGIQ